MRFVVDIFSGSSNLFEGLECEGLKREIKDKELRKKLVNMDNNIILHLLQIVIHIYYVFDNIFITGYELTEATFNYYHSEIRRTNI